MTLHRVRSVDPEPIVYDVNEPTRVQNLWWQTRAFSRRNQHGAKAVLGRKKVWVMIGYHSIQQMLSI